MDILIDRAEFQTAQSEFVKRKLQVIRNLINHWINRSETYEFFGVLPDVIRNILVRRVHSGMKRAQAQHDHPTDFTHRLPMRLWRRVQIQPVPARPCIGLFYKGVRKVSRVLPDMSMAINDHLKNVLVSV